MPFPVNKEPLEKDIQKAILAWLSYQPNCFCWVNKTQGTFDPQKKIFRAHTTQRGVSDILGIWNGKFLAIEVKRKHTYPTLDQRQFMEKIVSLGGIAFVARSVDDVVASLLKSAVHPESK